MDKKLDQSVINELNNLNQINIKDYITDLVNNNDKRLKYMKTNGKSIVWSKFERIYYENIETNYVKCKFCNNIKKQNRHIGTGGLLKHKCHQSDDGNQQSADDNQQTADGNQQTADDNQPLVVQNSDINLEVVVETDNAFDYQSNELLRHENDCVSQQILIDKTFLVNLIQLNDNRVRFVAQNGKSEVWNRFERIYYENMETDYVKCKLCDDIHKHNRNIGTGGLLRHKCSNNLIDNQNKPNIVFNIENTDQNNSQTNDESINNEYNTDRKFFINLFNNCDQRLSFVTENGKSEVWTKFERIYFDHNETEYVKCKYCDDIHKQNRNIGTGSLLRHKCKDNSDVLRNQNSISDVKRIDTKIFMRKCQSIDEKIRCENKTLKHIIKKCLEVMEKCSCIKTNIINDKKHINVLINNYNEWLFDNQDIKASDNEDFDDITDESFDENNQLSDDSDKDIDYKPFEQIKQEINDLNIKIINTKPKSHPIFKTKRVYRRRKGSVNDPNARYQCDWSECGKVFKSKYVLKEHRNIHLGLKRHRCLWPGCEAAFLKKTQYDVHICSHTNEKKFKCDWPECGYKSCRKTMLLRHKKVHTGEKPHVCDWPGCEFKASFGQGLKSHKLTHTGEKPWKCSWPSCEWSFRQKTHLKAHMNKHTGEKPFLCESLGCGRKFSAKQALRIHIEKTHNS